MLMFTQQEIAAVDDTKRQQPILDPYWISTRDPRCVEGVVFNREGFPDGSTIITSRVVILSDGYLLTKSGTQYRLGKKLTNGMGV